MPNTSPAWLLKLPLIVCALALASCSATPPILPPPLVIEREIPPLPKAAKQPAPPPVCVQSCSDGLTMLRLQLLPSPMRLGEPASSASAPTRL